MKMKNMAAVAAGLILASGTILMAMGNKNESGRSRAGGSEAGIYSSGAATNEMMRGSSTNFNTGSDMSTRSSVGGGIDTRRETGGSSY